MSDIERNKVKNFGEPWPCPSETADGFMVVRCFLTPPPGNIGLSNTLKFAKQQQEHILWSTMIIALCLLWFFFRLSLFHLGSGMTLLPGGGAKKHRTLLLLLLLYMQCQSSAQSRFLYNWSTFLGGTHPTLSFLVGNLHHCMGFSFLYESCPCWFIELQAAE